MSINGFRKSVVLFCAGKRCLRIVDLSKNSLIYIAAIFDNALEKQGKNIDGISVLPKNRIDDYCDFFWCITVADKKQYSFIRKELIDEGFISNREIIYDELLLQCCYTNTTITGLINKGNDFNGDFSIIFGCTNGIILGGVEARTIILCDELVNRGYKSVSILSDVNGHSIDIPHSLENHIIRSFYGKSNVKSVDLIKNYVEIIVKNLPCVLITNEPGFLLMAAYLVRCFMADKIFIVSNISMLEDTFINSYLSYGEYSDHYVGVSSEIVKEFNKRGIFNNIDYVCVPFECDRELNRGYSKIGEPIIIGYAGRLDGMEKSQKRMDLVLKLIEKLHENEVPFIFNVAGDGPAKEIMVARIEQIGIGAQVNFWGYVNKSDIKFFWRNQDVAINMADYEGRSISVVEAMGAGAVPVVTDTSGVRDDIIDGENGFIVSLGDYLKAAKKIEYLFHHKELLPRMGIKAHDEVFPKSSVDKYVDYWEKLLNKLIGRSNG